jgi:hypothetical protein
MEMKAKTNIFILENHTLQMVVKDWNNINKDHMQPKKLVNWCMNYLGIHGSDPIKYYFTRACCHNGLIKELAIPEIAIDY